MPAIKISECAVGTENFYHSTGNGWVYMIEMGRRDKELMSFRKQEKYRSVGKIKFIQSSYKRLSSGLEVNLKKGMVRDDSNYLKVRLGC